ncbi:MAG TPA: hypothetical protein DCP23_10495, partial [Parabacteroides distasonis]|nr:hypothetical protein [Parabacteroides distasonis]
ISLKRCKDTAFFITTKLFDEKMWMNMNFVWMWLRKCLMVLKTGHLVKNNDCLPYYSMEKT